MGLLFQLLRRPTWIQLGNRVGQKYFKLMESMFRSIIDGPCLSLVISASPSFCESTAGAVGLPRKKHCLIQVCQREIEETGCASSTAESNIWLEDKPYLLDLCNKSKAWRISGPPLEGLDQLLLESMQCWIHRSWMGGCRVYFQVVLHNVHGHNGIPFVLRISTALCCSYLEWSIFFQESEAHLDEQQDEIEELQHEVKVGCRWDTAPFQTGSRDIVRPSDGSAFGGKSSPWKGPEWSSYSHIV